MDPYASHNCNLSKGTLCDATLYLEWQKLSGVVWDVLNRVEYIEYLVKLYMIIYWLQVDIWDIDCVYLLNDVNAIELPKCTHVPT